MIQEWVVLVFDTIIVGAGAIGMMTAQLLSQTGQKICLIDKANVGSESSWAGGGILSPLYPWRYSNAVNQLATWSQHHYPDFLANLNADTGIDSECLKSGLLIRNINEERTDIEFWLKSQNTEAKFVSASTAHKIEPVSSDINGDSLWLPNIGQIRNPRFVKALHQSMKIAGITIHDNCEVLRVITENQQFTAVKTALGMIKAKNLIIASGAWSAELLNNIDNQLSPVKIKPVRGQMMIIKTPANTLKRIILDKEHYLIPRRDGRILIGSTLEFVGFDKSITNQAYDILLKAAISIVPSLAQFPVEHHWAGLRPGTSDGIPYICKHPELSGIYINSGHYRNGIVLGLASAQLMVNIVLRENPILDPAPYQCPNRV